MPNRIAVNSIIYPGVTLGDNIIIEDFCIIGYQPSGAHLETKIGDNAIIRAHTVIYAGNTIGNNFQTGNKANIRECNRIGDNVSIGTLSVVEHHVEIGSDVRIHSQAFIPEYSILKDNCWIGPNVVLTNTRYPCSPTAKQDVEGVVIEEHVKIGANSTILPGVVIGAGALIGAGSVVTKNIEQGWVVAGNPAILIKMLDTITNYAS